jgi:16S rRNA (guanine(966)-N(2))-methyltransferase RsmD
MVRIIAGKHHGRHLVTPDGRDVRPTSDRVKTALFNILGTWIAGKSVLELYAGAGSIGFECLSRGAAHVTFVETNPASQACIIENAMLLRENEQITLLKADVNALLAHPGSRTYDFIYADPPYREGDPISLMAGLEHAGMYHDETIVIIEHSNRRAMEKGSIFSGWECYRAAHYGKSVLSFFSRNV